MQKTVMAAEELTAKATLRIDLSYRGSSAPEENFTVLLTPLDGAPEAVEGESQSIPLSFHTPSGSLNFTFNFTEEGIYTYRVREQAGQREGVSYDDTVYEVSFEVFFEYSSLKSVMRVVRDDESIGKPDAISFANGYQASGEVIGDPPVKIKKVLSGDVPARAVDFDFVMKAVTEGAPLPGGATGDSVEVTIHGAGELEMGDIVFKAPGIYEYAVTEENGHIAGYSYDNAVYKVIYTVTQDADGSLSCERKILKNNFDGASECVFTNSYKASGGSGKKGGPLVKTGDEAPVALGIGLVAAAAVLIGAAVVLKRKKRG